jgi:2-polyprenyl-6-methoxyphenol hydroxylase-like FAD-dependent oxidoreductase
MVDSEVSVRCCIAGGGPAGMMLGFLLARAGVSVLVLEKHADFLRDFRGDTIHPSTLEIMYELELLDEFLQRPHQEVRTLRAQIGDEFVEVADFTHLPSHCRFIAFMPQWDFLDFLVGHAKRFPAFQLKMEAEARDLTVESGVVTGLLATTPGGSRCADGRAVDARLTPIGGSGANPRAGRYRPHLSDAQPRRLLAMRLRDRERRV